jgi:UDP-N-acetylmuramate--alanine ligase
LPGESRAGRGREVPPLSGRKIWFVGIGGAGLSGYAVLSKAWGAEVAGWDKQETPYVEHVRAAGIEVTISPDPREAPPGWEAVVSTAYVGRAEGRRRADFLAELVSLQRAVVVAGSHGKTTTAAMIAFCLERRGDEPAFLIGGDVPQLGGNARAGGGWLVVEGDESDRTVFSLAAEIAVVTNVDLDHHATFASAAELEDLLRRWAERAPKAVWGPDLEPVALKLAVPGEHNRRNAACAFAALELAGVPVAEAQPLLADFRGAGRRFEARGEAAGVRVFDDYGHHPAELAATVAAARGLADGRVLVLFQPHLYSRTVHLAHEFAAALTAADVACVTDIYAAREAPVDGVTGKLLVERLCELRPGMPVAWAPRVEEGAEIVARLGRAGDVILTIGAGDVDAAVPLILARLRS